jgi:hypothetical protein
VHGLKVGCFSLQCAVAAILSITLPYHDDLVDVVDYTRALVVLLSQWFDKSTPKKAPTCITVMFRLRTDEGVMLLPELADTTFAVGTTKFAGGISSEERAMWRRSRCELLASVLGENSAFPTRVPTIRLSELESLRRTTNDPVHAAQLELFNRRLATIIEPRPVLQSVGDCAETIPLAVMANLPGGGSIVTFTVLTTLVLNLRPMLRTGKFTPRIESHDPCANCRLAFARAQLRGTTVLEPFGEEWWRLIEQSKDIHPSPNEESNCICDQDLSNSQDSELPSTSLNVAPPSSSDELPPFPEIPLPVKSGPLLIDDDSLDSEVMRLEREANSRRLDRKTLSEIEQSKDIHPSPNEESNCICDQDLSNSQDSELPSTSLNVAPPSSSDELPPFPEIPLPVKSGPLLIDDDSLDSEVMRLEREANSRRLDRKTISEMMGIDHHDETEKCRLRGIVRSYIRQYCDLKKSFFF